MNLNSNGVIGPPFAGRFLGFWIVSRPKSNQGGEIAFFEFTLTSWARFADAWVIW